MSQVRNIMSGKDMMGRRFHFVRFIVIYLVLCIAGIAFLAFYFNELIVTHDEELTTQIGSLVAEKMDHSIRYMSDSVENMGQVIDTQDVMDTPTTYEELIGSVDEATYESLGLIAPDGTVYATEAEINEFEKWELLAVAEEAHDGQVAMSSPYRSSITGKQVFTLFTKLEKNGEYAGVLFVTYPLTEIERMADTRSLDSNTEIWLMNAAAGNIINCSGQEDYQLGSWSNIRLVSGDINRSDMDDYEEWFDNMRKGDDYGVVSFNIGKTRYTQVFTKINSMDGWYIVIRIPGNSLSSASQDYRRDVMVFLLLMTLATFALMVFFYRRNRLENELLQNLSIHDPLTDVLNRRAFEVNADKYIRQRRSCILIFLDVDHFKDVNDNFGHKAGDRVLISFASALKTLFADDGFVSRYGGDEFEVLVTGNLKPKVVDMKLKKIKPMVSELLNSSTTEGDRNDDFSEYKFTFSAGLAISPDNGKTLQELRRAADESLYKVKNEGRDGFSWHS